MSAFPRNGYYLQEGTIVHWDGKYLVHQFLEIPFSWCEPDGEFLGEKWDDRQVQFVARQISDSRGAA